MDVNRFEFESRLLQSGASRVAGVDEAGRGPLAGPVVAAAVVLPASWCGSGLPEALEGLTDSKRLTAAQRERFFDVITSDTTVACSIARVDAEVIDRINILQATYRAMNQALAGLPAPPDHVLVDGRPVPAITLPQTNLIKGDSRSYSIAAASVLAKVTRDRLMADYDRQWPAYGFADHKGYGTERHRAAIEEHGACPIHRKSFAPLREEMVTMELFQE